MITTISMEAWSNLAKALEVKVSALRAVATVESAGSGFAADGRPKVLFEGHIFHRLTQGRFSAGHPTLSFPKWTKLHYAKTQALEWQRLEKACNLDRAAALQSASWGMFQIMGFNYPLCGFGDVEAFTAQQRAGADQQLESFARFISRDVFLKPLRGLQWVTFARNYNGPGYEKNQYHTKMASAFAAFEKLAPPAKPDQPAPLLPAKVAKKLSPKPPGRQQVAAVPNEHQRSRRLPVKADRVDLRDWVYRPSIRKAPPETLFPHDLATVSDQGNTSSCTGFALATTIEYLLDKAKRPVERISGHMLYSMARRYDEWAGNEDPVDEHKKGKSKKEIDRQKDMEARDSGSSLRGALKGWSRHGASKFNLWQDFDMPKASNSEDDWWLDAVRRPLGAYYRMSLDVESDLHVALHEVGVLYASAYTHGGWQELLADHPSEAPTSVEQLPIIKCRKGDEDGGHAFALVGYTDKGFIVHNSWGPSWGRGGFAILTYSDWRQNAMDCWVAQLGVTTREHEEVARAPSLRLADMPKPPKAGKVGRKQQLPHVVLSSNAELANHEISPFVVDMQNEGRLSDRGRFRTSEEDLKFLLEYHLDVARKRWGISSSGTIDVAVYAHGGLVDEDAAAESARQWVPLLYGNRIFPIFLMWETSGLSTIFNIVEDALKGDDERIAGNWLDKFRDRVVEWKDERIEGLARAPGGAMWRQMKDNSNDLSSTPEAGVVRLFRQFKTLHAAGKLPNFRLHLIGHSAGAIVQSHLAPRAVARGFKVDSLSLLAPALRVDHFNERLGKLIQGEKIRVLVSHLTDAAERSDDTCKPYGHSLLYLVARAFEGKHGEIPLIGMEKHLVPACAVNAWGQAVERLATPGNSYRPGDPVTRAATHGGVDDDIAVQDAVIRHIKGAAWENQPVVRDSSQLRKG